jgi:hypothetical protein
VGLGKGGEGGDEGLRDEGLVHHVGAHDVICVISLSLSLSLSFFLSLSLSL